MENSSISRSLAAPRIGRDARCMAWRVSRELWSTQGYRRIPVRRPDRRARHGAHDNYHRISGFHLRNAFGVRKLRFIPWVRLRRQAVGLIASSYPATSSRRHPRREVRGRPPDRRRRCARKRQPRARERASSRTAARSGPTMSASGPACPHQRRRARVDPRHVRPQLAGQDDPARRTGTCTWAPIQKPAYPVRTPRRVERVEERAVALLRVRARACSHGTRPTALAPSTASAAAARRRPRAPARARRSPQPDGHRGRRVERHEVARPLRAAVAELRDGEDPDHDHEEQRGQKRRGCGRASRGCRGRCVQAIHQHEAREGTSPSDERRAPAERRASVKPNSFGKLTRDRRARAARAGRSGGRRGSCRPAGRSRSVAQSFAAFQIQIGYEPATNPPTPSASARGAPQRRRDDHGHGQHQDEIHARGAAATARGRARSPGSSRPRRRAPAARGASAPSALTSGYWPTLFSENAARKRGLTAMNRPARRAAAQAADLAGQRASPPPPTAGRRGARPRVEERRAAPRQRHARGAP